MAAADAWAAVNLNSSRSNVNTTPVISVPLIAGDAKMAKACTDNGGKILTDGAGNKICVLPDTTAGAAAATTVKSSKSNGSDRTVNLNSSKSNAFKITAGDGAAEKACTDKKGTVYTDAAGGKICLLPAAPPPPPPAQ